MSNYFRLAALSLVLGLAGCGKSDSSATPGIALDHSTPEGAILCLEEAYRNKDLEAAVGCKDFKIEAKFMLQKLQKELADDAEVLAKTAEVLELGFRSEMKEKGFPDFRGVESSFPQKAPYEGREDVVQVTEECRSGNGPVTKNILVVAKTATGWKVITVPD